METGWVSMFFMVDVLACRGKEGLFLFLVLFQFAFFLKVVFGLLLLFLAAFILVVTHAALLLMIDICIPRFDLCYLLVPTACADPVADFILQAGEHLQIGLAA